MVERGQDTGVILHASCVAVRSQAVLILGASGSGKSGLSLSLMALGARLVADDRSHLFREADRIIAQAPDALVGLIEARGVGILRADPAPPTPVALLVDMDRLETERLPPNRHGTVLGQSVPLLHKVDSAHFPAAILQYLNAGRWSES